MPVPNDNSMSRKQRRKERRASRFKKESIADGKAAEQNMKNGPEDPQGGTIESQSVTSENFYVKTKDGVLTSMGTDVDGKRYKPGFTPNELYWHNTFGWYVEDDNGVLPNGWYGNLLDTHFSKISGQNRSKNRKYNPILLEFDERLGKVGTKPNRNEKPTYPQEAGSGLQPYSKRDTLLLNNDASTDYFLHDTLLEGRNIGVGEGVTPEATGRTLLYESPGSSWENQDPVIYGFEVIIDALSSPLLNGAVEEFIDAYPNVSEIQSRRRALYDFKLQLQKLFKTRGNITIRNQERDLFQNEALYSDYNHTRLNKYANTANPQGSNINWRGKKAYLSHYLNKIDGLHKLNISSVGATKTYLTEWQKDLIKLTFNEDVSGTMAALMHLYNTLYWSKVNGKGVIPENLLRFNCDIIVCEVRNFNRVRNATDTKTLQVIKDNVSRYKYSLKECQFYFDTPSHGDSIDYSQNQAYDGYVVNFDYKFASLKYEKWVSDERNFGQYVGYNNASIWKIGNRGGRLARQQAAQQEEGGGTGVTVDESYPKFYTRGTNSLGQDGVKNEIELMNYQYSGVQEPDEDEVEVGSANEPPSGVITRPIGNPGDEDDQNEGKLKRAVKGGLQNLKKKSKQMALRSLKGLWQAPLREIKAQVGIRAQLLMDTVEKIKNLAGLGGLDTEPTNVYPKPYTPIGMGIFFDVRNQLYDYFSEDISTIMGNAANIINPFNSPGIEGILPDKLKKANAPSVWFNPLSQLLKKFSSVPSVISSSTLPNLSEAGKIGGFENFMVQYPNSAQKFPNPVVSMGDIVDILNSKASMNKPKDETPVFIPKDPNVNFGGSAVQPSSDNVKSQGNLEDIVKKNTIWPYPVNNKKFGKNN